LKQQYPSLQVIGGNGNSSSACNILKSILLLTPQVPVMAAVSVGDGLVLHGAGSAWSGAAWAAELNWKL